MAGSIRGITIEIGGDSTNLQKALKSAKSAASTLQTQLRTLNSALKFDTDSPTALASKFSTLQDRAQALAAKLAVTKDYFDELKAATVSVDGVTYSVEELGEKTDNAALQASYAKEKYNAVNAELESLHNQINSNIESNDELGLSFSDIRQRVQEVGFDQAISELRETGTVSEELVNKLELTHDAWQNAFNENEAYQAVVEMQKLQTQIDQTKAEIKNLATGMLEVRDNSKDVEKPLKEARSQAQLFDNYIDTAADALDKCGSKSDEFSQSVKSGKDAIREMQSVLENTSDKVKDIANSTDDLTPRIEEVRTAWVNAKTELLQAQGTLDSLKATQEQLNATSDTSDENYKNLADAIQEVEEKVETLAAKAKAAEDDLLVTEEAQSYKELSTQAEKAYDTIDNLTGTTVTSVHGLGDGVRDIGQAFSEVSSVASQVLGEIIESTTDVSDAYYDMRKTVEGTEEEFEALYDAAINASNTSVTSAADLLEIEAMGGQLGLAVDELEVFSETVSNLTIASDLEADVAAEDLGQLANILDDLDADTMPNFADSMVRLGNNTAATESNIMDVATRIGSMGSIVGLTSPEILALSASLVETGMNSEAAGTAMANTMSNIETAVAGGGDSLDAFAEVANMSASDFADTWNNDPLTAIQSFVEGLVSIEDGGGSADETLQELGITSTRQKQAIEGLMQTVDGLNDNVEMSQDAWDGVSDSWGEAGDAANEAEAKSEGFAGELTQLKNAASNIAAQFGDSLTPVISAAADVLASVSSAVSDLPDGVKLAAVGVTALTAAVGPATTAFGNLLEGAANLTDSLSANSTAAKNVATATKTATTATKASTTATKAATSATGALNIANTALKGTLATLGISAAILIGTQIYSYFKQTKEEAEETEEALKSFDDILGDAEVSSENAAAGIEQIGTSSEEVEEHLSELREEMANANEEFEETLTQINTDSANLDRYIGIIDELGGSQSLTATETTELQTALEYVNEVLGTSYELHEDTAGVIYDEDEEVEDITKDLQKLADEYENTAKMEAYYNQLVTYNEELATAYIDLQEAKDSGDEQAIKEAEEAVAACEAQVRDATTAYTMLAEEISGDLADAVNGLDSKWRGAATNMVTAFSDTLGDKFTEEMQGELADLMTEAAETGDWTAVAEFAEEKGVDISSALATAIEDGAEIDDATAEMLTGLAADLDNESGDAIRSAAGIGDDVINALNDALDASDGKLTNADLTGALQEVIQNGDWSSVISMCQEYGVAIPDSVATAITDGSYELDESTATMLTELALDGDANAQDILAQYGDLGDDVISSLATAVEDGSIDVEDATDTISTALASGDWNSLVQLYAQNGEALPDSLALGLQNGEGDISSETERLLALLYLSTDDPTVEESITSALGIGTAEATAIKDGLDGSKESVITGVTDLIQAIAVAEGNEAAACQPEWRDSMEDTVGVLVEEVAAGEEPLSESISDLWDEAEKGTKEGTKSTKKEAKSGTKEIANTVLGTLDIGDEMYSSGYDVTSNWAAGLAASQAISKVQAAVSEVVSVVTNSMKFSVPKEGPFSGAEKGGATSGKHLIENFASGMLSAKSEVEEAASEVAAAASDALTSAVDETALQVSSTIAVAVDDAAISASSNAYTTSTTTDRTDEIVAAIASLTENGTIGTTINQTFDTKVVRSDSDLYSASSILYRNAIREASLAS